MSLAFKTLQLDQLREYPGCGDHSIRGLNVISPLLQSVYLKNYTRAEARKSLENSHDPEIRQYNAFRVQQLQTEAASNPIPSDKQLTSYDALVALSHATPNNLRDSLKGLATAVSQDPADTHPCCDDRSETIFGSRQARIGIILDDDILAIGSPEESDFPEWVPKILGTIGFTRDNLRVWAWNFGAKTDSRQLDVQEENQDFHQRNQYTINESGLRVIILGGKDAERVVTAPLKLVKIKVEVGKLYINGFIETKNEIIIRLYLAPEVPLSSISLSDHAPSAKACLAIKIATLLTETQGIRPHLFRSRVAVGEIVLLRAREQDEGISLGPESLSSVVWAWLYNTGFQRSDLDLIQEIGGSSVSRGILLAMCTAPKCPPKYRGKAMERIPRKDSDLHESFSPYQLEAMKDFHKRLANRKDASMKPGAHENQGIDEDSDFLTSEEAGKDGQCDMLPMIAKECLTQSMTVEDHDPFTFNVPPRASKHARIPFDLRGKIQYCWWCTDSAHSATKTGKETFPSWNDELHQALCSSCAVHAHKEKYLPIVRSRILHLEISCGHFGSVFGYGWQFSAKYQMMTCSPHCKKLLLQRQGIPQPADLRERARQSPAQDGKFRYQDRMLDKLRMSRPLVAYFKETFGLDTSITALGQMYRNR
ncbi:hypothetical protein N7540_000268 [Penicillium herquei]|nr:hypothetical protein N7540_000268 [Penicillium herquei]